MDWKDALGALQFPDEPGAEAEEPKVEAVEKEKKVSWGNIHISEERKGRNGKTATIIYGFTCDDDELQKLASKMKQTLGCGGSARCGEILLQGAVREKAEKLLKELKIKK